MADTTNWNMWTPLLTLTLLLTSGSENSLSSVQAFSHSSSLRARRPHDRFHFVTTARNVFPSFGGDGNNKKWSGTTKCTTLPTGLSPFEKSIAKGKDLQATFRQLAAKALQRALQDDVELMEIDFPPFVGGDQSKTAFDDYDNLQELDANRDWCVQWVPSLPKQSGSTWLVFPDDKECQLAKEMWTGQRYQQSSQYTSIRAAVIAVSGGTEKQLSKAWGTTIASTFNKLTGGDGILADSAALDPLDVSNTEQGRLHIVCQPGNGGPVEDWINVEKLHKLSSASTTSSIKTCVVNGALDKVRDGYYAGFIFPALAATVPFYKQFEGLFILKPITTKGLYGWLFRVYPEPWQVVLQTARSQKKGSQTVVNVENKVALQSETRPTYQETVDALIRAAQSQ